MKMCSKCKIEKPFAEFHRDKTKKDGFDYRCKSCIADKSLLYGLKNAEMLRVKSADYRRNCTDKYKVTKKKSDEKFRANEANRLKHIEYARCHYSRNKDKWAESSSKHVSLLTDYYVSCQLHMGKSATKELIEAKRIHIQIKRKLKELKA